MPDFTLESEIRVMTEFPITFAPMRALRATVDPAKLMAAERISDSSAASRLTQPSAVTSESSRIAAVTWLAMTLPKPVAFTATAPEPATPTVKATIPALESASRSIFPPASMVE